VNVFLLPVHRDETLFITQVVVVVIERCNKYMS